MLAESDNERQTALVQKPDTQVSRLTALIHTLLDTTRIAEGGLQLAKTRFGIDELITETAESLQPVAGAQKIEFKLQAGVQILADPERIRQVLVNLLSNALRYAPTPIASSFLRVYRTGRLPFVCRILASAFRNRRSS